MTRSTLKVGLVGLGRMGQNHLRNLTALRDVDLIGVFDIDSALAQQISQSLNLPIFDSIIHLAQYVDAIILVTPTSAHAEQIRSLAGLVPFLFVEKPFVPDPEQSQELMNLCQAKQTQIQVGFIERFNPAVSVLQGIFERVGPVLQTDFYRANKFSSRIRDVDVIIDLMVHDLDLALYLFGPVQQVQSHGFQDDDRLVCWARTLLQHQGGQFTQITASRITDRRIRQISSTCRDGFVDANLLRREVDLHRQYHEQYSRDISVSAKIESVDVKPQESLLLELQAFVRACHTNDFSLVPTATDSTKVVQLCQTIQKQITSIAKLS